MYDDEEDEPLEEWERELLDKDDEPEDEPYDIVVTEVGTKIWLVGPHARKNDVMINYIDNNWVIALPKEAAVKLVYALTEYLKK